MSKRIIAVIDEHLNGHGQAVFEAAVNAGFEVELNEAGHLDIADACALVDHESGGGQLIFGCDHGAVGDRPPYCHQSVTKARVQALRDGGNYPRGLQGIGLSQITWWEYVEEAERRGGAHLPEHQLSVGFEVLKEHVDALGYKLGIAAYNAGRGNAEVGVTNGYYAKVQAAREKWVELLKEAAVVDWPQRSVYMDSRGWMRDRKTDAFVIAPGLAGWEESAGLGNDEEGYVYATNAYTPTPTEISLVPAGHIDLPVVYDGTYLGEFPTRYSWRADVEKAIRRVYREFGNAVHINTYRRHPPVWERDTTSFDVWGPGGRGDPIDPDLGQRAHDFIFNDPEPPNIWWIIWRGWMWTRAGGWEASPPGAPDSDPGHHRHIHCTMED